jgi:hypothetical protein
MLDYYLVPNTLTTAQGTYRAVVTQQENAEGTAYVKLAAKTLNMSEGEIVGILNGLASTGRTLIGQGWGFTLPGFGKFSFGFKGNFDGPNAVYDPALQKVSVNFLVDKTLTSEAQTAPKNRIHGVVHGPVIDSVVDMGTNAVNTNLSPGGNIKISGKNIKIVGEDPTVGIDIIDAAGESVMVQKMVRSRNGPTELVFICPALSAGVYRIKVTTQYSGGSKHHIEPPRTFTFDTPLTVS